MEQHPHQPAEITWIPLKEAARMLGCSVKTIRRRIKGGTWRSMIEYQGQKAIRLVAREDVLKESSSLHRLPADSPERALAIQALDGLPAQLGEVLGNYLGGLKQELDRRAFYSRIYLLISLGLTAILLTGLGFYFSNRREEILEGRIGAVSRTLSTSLTGIQAGLGRELASISRQTEENHRLAEDAREESGRRSEVLEKLLTAVNSLEKRGREEHREAAEYREEIAGLRREIARLEEALDGRLPDPEDPGDTDRPEAEEPVVDQSPPETGPTQPPPAEEKKSRFLGIF